MADRESADINDDLRVRVWRDHAGEKSKGAAKNAMMRANKFLKQQDESSELKIKGECVVRVPPPIDGHRSL